MTESIEDLIDAINNMYDKMPTNLPDIQLTTEQKAEITQNDGLGKLGETKDG